MKKLMIAAAIVCAAVVSQAASTTWTFTAEDIKDGTTTGFAEGAQAYVILYSADYGKSDIGLSQDALLEGIRKGGKMSDYSAYALGGVTVDATGNIGSTTVTFDNEWIEDDYVSAYLAVIADDKIYLGVDDWFEKGSVVEKMDGDFVMGTTATSAFADKTGTGTFDDNGAGWYTVSSVPEPTSGLLLLLGVAGLALKRRRA